MNNQISRIGGNELDKIMKRDNSGWQVKSLGELVTDIRYGMNASADCINEGTKFLRVTDITTNGSVNYSNLPNVVANLKEVEKYFLKEGDCVIARSGSVGKAHIFNGQENVVFASYLIRLKFNKEMLYPPYFGAFSQTRFYWDQILSNTKGGVQQNINTEGLSRIKIPLPPLPIQKQIAEILEKTDQAKQKRKEANKLTDEFLQSEFIEMFGDPVKNPKGFPIEPLEKVCVKITDGTHNSPRNDENGIYKYITAKNIKKNGIDLRNITYISEIDHKAIYSRCNAEFEDVLYIKDGVTTGIAQVNKLKEEFSMLSSLALFKLNKLVLNPYYLRDYLNNNNVYQNIRNSMGGAAITRLTVDKLKRIKVVLPPLSLQQQFADIVNKTESLKEKQKQSEQELENLFQCLMQKAFNGELNFN